MESDKAPERLALKLMLVPDVAVMVLRLRVAMMIWIYYAAIIAAGFRLSLVCLFLNLLGGEMIMMRKAR